MRLAGIAVLLTVPAVPPARPAQHATLGIIVVLDGLRADLLARYDSLFVGGFRRLRDGGYSFTNAKVDHAITVSHAGHVTIATGRFPTHHGIVDAGYYVPVGRGGRALHDAIADTAVHSVGSTPSTSSASPRQILVTGLSDWVCDANPDSRIAGVGTGQFSSLLHVYRPGTPVIWYSPRAGEYVTSSYYLDTLPGWVRAFNARSLIGLADTATYWLPITDLSRFDLGRPDSSPWEMYGRHSAFPHRLVDLLTPAAQPSALQKRRWIVSTPYLDLATLRLADSAIRTLSLGQRAATDYLGIVLSETDEIGHSYGPNSHEMLDVLLRIDRWLGEFFLNLDQSVGRGKWVLALTADHGMAEIPEWTAAHDHPAWRITQPMIDTLMREAAALVATGRSSEMRSLARGRPWIAAFYSPRQLSGDVPADSFITLYRRSWRRDRVPRLPVFDTDSGTSAIAKAGWMVRLSPGSLIDLDPANHGSPYNYDRDVPLFFFGAGVMHGTSGQPVRTVDIAPTMAALLGIKAPAGLDGVVLPVVGAIR